MHLNFSSNLIRKSMEKYTLADNKYYVTLQVLNMSRPEQLIARPVAFPTFFLFLLLLFHTKPFFFGIILTLFSSLLLSIHSHSSLTLNIRNFLWSIFIHKVGVYTSSSYSPKNTTEKNATTGQPFLPVHLALSSRRFLMLLLLLLSLASSHIHSAHVAVCVTQRPTGAEM